jgi:hypothetical protein
MRHSQTALGWLTRWSKSIDCSAIRHIYFVVNNVRYNILNKLFPNRSDNHQYDHPKHHHKRHFKHNSLCPRLHFVQLLLLLKHSQRRCKMWKRLGELPSHAMPSDASDALLVSRPLVGDAPRPGLLPTRNGSWAIYRLTFAMTRRIGHTSFVHAITSVKISTRKFFAYPELTSTLLM